MTSVGGDYTAASSEDDVDIGLISRGCNQFSFSDISYSAVDSKGSRKQILTNVTANALSQECLAILGPSGAGKTSLLSVLTLNANGKQQEITGRCTLNNQQVDRNIFAKHFCIVPQIDSQRAFLTCRETLRFVANFYINGDDKYKDDLVDRLLKKLGLDQQANTIVGNQFIKGLSGGQIKRLSIGLALLKRPAVLLLDEPTSGLDAAASSAVMKYIKSLAVSFNIIVVATIHQPSSLIYYSFEKVLLLSEGRTAYFGTAKGSVEYFEKNLSIPLPLNSNPAECILDAINSEFTDPANVHAILDTWSNDYAPSHSKTINGALHVTKSNGDVIPVNIELPLTDQVKLSHLQQFYFVTSRQLRILTCDPMIYLGRACMYLFICTFFAIIYVHSRDRNQKQVYDRLWIIIWFCGTPTSLGVVAVYAFNEELKTIIREVKNGMFSTTSYLLSSLMIQLPVMFVLAVFAVGIPGFAICNFYGPNFMQIVCMYACIYSSFESIARCLSVAFDNSLLGMLSYLNCWFTSFLFASIVIPEDHVIWPFRAFFYVFPLKWGIPAIAYSDMIETTFAGASLCTDTNDLSCIFNYDSSGNAIVPGYTCGSNTYFLGCYGHTGAQVLDSLGFTFKSISSNNELGLDFGVVIAIGIFFHCIYIVQSLFKANEHSVIVDTTAPEKFSFFKMKSSSDSLVKLAKEADIV